VMDVLLERLDAEGVVHWTFSSSEVRDGSVYPMIWDHLLSGDAEVRANQWTPLFLAARVWASLLLPFNGAS